MSAHIEWLHARHIDVTGSAEPGSFEGPYRPNEVAAIRITSQYDGDGLIIEGRPEDLLAAAREILRAAELIVVQTAQTPRLLSLYGLTS